MQFELKKPLNVYDKESGTTEEKSMIIVSYTGKKGLQTLKRIQDLIYKSFAEQAKGADKKTQDVKEQEKESTVAEIFDMLEVTGNSEKVFDEICGTFKAFATISGVKLTDTMLEEIDIDDLDGLYEATLNHFLLPKICKKLNSMNK